MSESDQLLAVAFDLDGLMINTEEIYDEVGMELLQSRGKRFDQPLKDRMMGRPANAAFEEMIDHHELTDDVETLRRESDEIFQRLLPGRLAAMPGSLDLLAELDRAAIPKAIVTSSQRKFVDRCLALLAIQSPFDFVLTAADVECGKPAPDIYLKAAEQFGLSPKIMLVLEDSQVGCRAAVAAGAFVVAVPGEHSRHHEFTGSQFVAESLADSRIRNALRLGSN